VGWIKPPSKTLIDEALNDYVVIWAAAGHPHAVFPTTFEELRKSSGALPTKVGD
jgi:prolyl-tRNA editing enzyme YbaK/EbsC (Cys-tRNA(Pro) deacylase)